VVVLVYIPTNSADTAFYALSRTLPQQTATFTRKRKKGKRAALSL
jgi:hypothetical protein